MNIELLRQLKTLPLDAVFGLINESTKQAYISHTVNLRTRMGDLIDVFDLEDEVRFIVFLEGVQDLRYKLLYAQQFIDQYKQDGYEILGLGRDYINSKVRIRFSKDLRRALVVIVNSRKASEIVGIFKTVHEARDFVSQYYKKGDMVRPVYSVSREMKEYINCSGTSKSKI